LDTRLEALNFGLGQVRDLVQNVGASSDQLEKGWREQQAEHWRRLEAERERWEKSAQAVEAEMSRLRESYEKVVIGRLFFWIFYFFMISIEILIKLF
jgi:hypothetical protein